MRAPQAVAWPEEEWLDEASPRARASAAPAAASELPAEGAGAAALEAAARPNAVEDEDSFVLCAAFAELAREASEIERTAMDLDRAGDSEQAAACYRQAAERLARAASACPEANPDRAVLSRHAGQVIGRAVYLESLRGAPALAPIEEHIGRAELSIGAPQAGADRAAAAGGWRERAASAAAVGGAAGLLVLHAPLAAAALAAGAAYATTREDSAGQAARSMGDAGLLAAARAKALAEEKGLPEKVEGVISRVRSTDERLGISSKAQEVASNSWGTLRELDRRHGLSEKLGQGVSSASAGVASATCTAAGWASKLLSKRQAPSGAF